MKKRILLAAAMISCSMMLTGCGSAESIYKKGITAMESGRLEEAGDLFQKAIQKNGERAEYYIAYGMYLNKQSRYEDALKQFEKAYQDTENAIANVNNKQVYLGEAIAYYHMQKYDRSLELCDKALELKNTTSLNSHILCSKGVVLEALGRSKDALQVYQKAVDSNKENWQAYFRMAAIYQGNGKTGGELKDDDAAGQAKEILLSAYKKGEKDTSYYLGALASAGADVSAAEKYFKEYVKKGSGEYLTDAYDQLASIAINAQEYETAEKYLEQGRKNASGAAEVQLWKNQVLLMERQGLFGEALKLAKEYLQQNPDDKAMKKECRFLKTRDAVAKGNGALDSTVGEPDTQPTGDPDDGDNAVVTTQPEASYTAAEDGKNVNREESTVTPSSSAAKGTDDRQRTTQPMPTSKPETTRAPYTTVKPTISAATREPMVKTQERVD